MSHSINALTLEFLRWLSSQPRSYDDVMEAWRTSCSRHSVWEDAVNAQFVQVERARPGDRPKVTLTTKGEAALRLSRGRYRLD